MTAALSDSTGRQPAKAGDPLVCRLRALSSSSPELRDAALAYETILPIIREADLGVTPISISVRETVAKMERGSFILQDMELYIDSCAYSDLVASLAGALEQLGTVKSSGAGVALDIRIALEDESFDSGSFLMHVACGMRDLIGPLVTNHRLDHDLLWTLGCMSIRPALREWQQQLTPLVDASGWGKGYCFVCGATATLAELRGNNQSRHLRCGQCGADWPIRRLQCIYCGNDHHHSRGFLYAESQNDHARVEVCDKCSGYIKLISSFDPLPSDLLTVEDLATLRLDFISTERGYRRGHRVR